MCGIFGFVGCHPARLDNSALLRATADLFRLSESRGKEAAGLAAVLPDSIQVLRSPVRASQLIRMVEYDALVRSALPFGNALGGTAPIAVIGHSRLATSGSELVNSNNQPVVGAGMVAVHNGIIANDTDLWRRFPDLPHAYDVDTEVVLRLLRAALDQGATLPQAIRYTFGLIEGATSLAVFVAEYDALLLATNNGSLYTCRTESAPFLIFASERRILREFLQRRRGGAWPAIESIRQVRAGEALWIDLTNLTAHPFQFPGDAPLAVSEPPPRPLARRIEVKDTLSAPALAPKRVSQFVAKAPPEYPPELITAIDGLRRCTRCILPETVPFIDFDEQGVCNFCRNYSPLQTTGEDSLRKTVERARPAGTSDPDVLVLLSGGRDSTYALHYLRAVLGLDVIAYTYDWGMVTDLARRNMARICGKLGVEHVIVSADIHSKRANIRRNVNAWLRQPDLGIVPLFMAGDKRYLYHAAQVRQQTQCRFMCIASNLLEKTDFKTGFCGISPHRGTTNSALSLAGLLRQPLYYLGAAIRNPAYLNASLADTISAYFYYYFLKDDYLYFFRYVPWDEGVLNQTLADEYGWERAGDTETTWRIGDGTAAFYNYIYYTMAGFTENDTFRSNQIREGMLDRASALRTVHEENRPRYETIQWYCDVVGIDMNAALNIINQAPKRYPV